MRERVRHSRANLLLFVVFERIRSIFFLFYARVCVSLSLSARVLMSAKENAFRCSLFSPRACDCARRFRKRKRERERWRWKIFSKRRSPLEKEFGDLVLRAPDKDTERERATVSMKESIIRNDERKTVVVERASSFGRDAFFVFLFLL